MRVSLSSQCRNIISHCNILLSSLARNKQKRCEVSTYKTSSEVSAVSGFLSASKLILRRFFFFTKSFSCPCMSQLLSYYKPIRTLRSPGHVFLIVLEVRNKTHRVTQLSVTIFVLCYLMNLWIYLLYVFEKVLLQIHFDWVSLNITENSWGLHILIM